MLLEEFEQELARRGRALLRPSEVVYGFADLLWEPLPAREVLPVWWDVEPAFLALSAARYVALHRILGEIRYFAAPIAPDFTGWQATGPPVPGDSHDAPYEMGVLASVGDAAEFFWQYHLGASLAEIRVPRLPPPWRR